MLKRILPQSSTLKNNSYYRHCREKATLLRQEQIRLRLEAMEKLFNETDRNEFDKYIEGAADIEQI